MSLISRNLFFIRWETLLNNGSVSCGSVSSGSGVFIYDVFIINCFIISVFCVFSWGSVFITSLYRGSIFFNRFGSTI